MIRLDIEQSGSHLAAKIPAAVNLGHKTCLEKCGINPDTFNINGKISNPELMKMAFAGYLKSQNFDFDGYSSDHFKQFN